MRKEIKIARLNCGDWVCDAINDYRAKCKEEIIDKILISFPKAKITEVSKMEMSDEV